MITIRAILLAILIVSAVIGFIKGFARTALSLCAFLLIAVISSVINPYVGSYLQDNTPVYNTIKTECSKAIRSNIKRGIQKKLDDVGLSSISSSVIGSEITDEFDLSGILGKAKDALGAEAFQKFIPEMDITEYLGIPDILSGAFGEHTRLGLDDLLNANGTIEELSTSIAKTATYVLAYIISFIIAVSIYIILLITLHLLNGFPVLKSTDRVIGMVLGIFRAVIIIWLFFIVIAMFGVTQWASQLLVEIRSDAILRWLYNNNVILMVIMKML